MSFVHLHLLLNHVPVIGIVFVLGVLLAALWRRNSDVAKAGLSALVAVALVTVVVFLTGEPAEEAVEDLVGVSDALIHAHEDAALYGFIATGAAGAMALYFLWIFRRRELPGWATRASLVIVLIATGLMAWTANLGGQIRHSEIRPTARISAGDGERDH